MLFSSNAEHAGQCELASHQIQPCTSTSFKVFHWSSASVSGPFVKTKADKTEQFQSGFRARVVQSFDEAFFIIRSPHRHRKKRERVFHKSKRVCAICNFPRKAFRTCQRSLARTREGSNVSFRDILAISVCKCGHSRISTPHHPQSNFHNSLLLTVLMWTCQLRRCYRIS